ncbi:YcxB family protein [Oscillibacter sp. MSJ-2]|uniref:YcxB family protein n=1 Tax=Dysosmobacter acutus TaxID=2841504 RepID=A0ABS6F8W0_9FIRM|nr:YcxB family protein [Dysosmobacter acutus]MBU5625734.1 YcxB family protein [Dysosmobacter acutus]
MVVSFQYTREEWVRCHRKYLFLSRTLTQIELWLAAVLCVLCVAYLVYFGPAWKSVSLCILCAAVVGMFWFMYFRQPHRIYDKTPGFDLPHVLDFNEDGVDYRTEGFVTSTPWEKFVTYVETDEAFFLAESRSVYTMIPKRALVSAEEKNLRGILKDHLPKNQFPKGRR